MTDVTLTSDELAALQAMPVYFPLPDNDSEHKLYDKHVDAIGSLLQKHLIRPTLTHYKIVDAGRAALAAQDAKPPKITAAQFVEQGFAEKVKRGECVVGYCHLDVTSVNKHHGDWCMVWGTWGGEGDQVTNGHLLAHEYDLLEVNWLPATPQPAPAGEGDDFTEATLRKMWLRRNLTNVQNGLEKGEFIDYLVTRINLQRNKVEEFARELFATQASLAAMTARAEASESREAGLREALKPFADALEEIPEGLRSTLRIWNGEIGEESGTISLSISTDDLEAAKAALQAETSVPDGKGSEE